MIFLLNHNVLLSSIIPNNFLQVKVIPGKKKIIYDLKYTKYIHFCDTRTDITYKGLRLAYGKSTSGLKCNESTNKEYLVKHISLYYKVKTNYHAILEPTQGDGDNISYYSEKGNYLKNLLGLESKFVVKVFDYSHNQLGYDGDDTEYDWYTQPTYGLLSFWCISRTIWEITCSKIEDHDIQGRTPYYILRYIGETVNFDKTINDICSNKIDQLLIILIMRWNINNGCV